jgi:recombinational DNA repair protein (RecF pathway)
MVENGLWPLEPYPGALKPWQCRCMRCGDVVSPRYNAIQQGQGGCQRCAQEARADACRTPEAETVSIMRAAGLQPLEPYRNGNTPWRSRCLDCGQEVTSTLHNIKSGHGGCVFCVERAVLPAEAHAVMRAAGLEPLTSYAGAHVPWPCRCLRCRRPVSPIYKNVKNGHGCWYCNKNTPAPEIAVAFVRTRGLEPLEPFLGTHQRWACRCVKCGRTVRPTFVNLQRGPGGCRWCRDRGFNASEDALVYLITHEGYGATKIGITNAASERIIRHRRRGWQVVTTVKVPGEMALHIEANIISWWRLERRLPIYLGRYEMPHGGWTETVDSNEIDLADTMRRIRQMAESWR